MKYPPLTREPWLEGAGEENLFGWTIVGRGTGVVADSRGEHTAVTFLIVAREGQPLSLVFYDKPSRTMQRREMTECRSSSE